MSCDLISKRCKNDKRCAGCFWYRKTGRGRELCLCSEDGFNEVDPSYVKRISISKGMRVQFEDDIKRFVSQSKKTMEIFAGDTYYAAGADGLKRRILRRLSEMPNIELVYIWHNIHHADAFDSYEEIFKYDRR